MTSRIDDITKMLADTPDDVFLRYSLGMEYASAEQFDRAVSEFKRCIELEAEYLAAYVEAGKCLRSMGKLGEARNIFAAGMELAATSGESHMRDYIQQQLDSIPPDRT